MLNSVSKGVIDNTYFRRVHFYLLVNTPASMWDKYEALNAVGKNVLGELKNCPELAYNDIKVLITIIEFDQTCRITHCAEDVLDFTWSSITEGQVECACLGDAYGILLDLLKEDKHNCCFSGRSFFPPIIICLCHSMPCGDYYEALKFLKENSWFNLGSRLAIRIGDDDWVDGCLDDFTCDKHAVFVSNTAQELYSIFRSLIIATFLATIKGKLDNVSLNQHRLQYVYNHLSMVLDIHNASYTYSENSWDVTLNTTCK